MQLFKGHNCLGEKIKCYYLLEFSAPILLESCYYLYSKTERLSSDGKSQSEGVCGMGFPWRIAGRGREAAKARLEQHAA